MNDGSPGVVVHRTRSLPVADRTMREGLPVTRPARTLIELAAVVELGCLEAAVDSALREGLISVDHLERRLAALGSRGRGGIEALRALLEERRDEPPSDSPAENRLARQLMAAGLPRPVRQYPVDGMRFDLAYPDVLLAIEYDSYRYHYGRQAWRRDQARHNRATAHGWLVFHVTEGEGVEAVVQAYRARAAA